MPPVTTRATLTLTALLRLRNMPYTPWEFGRASRTQKLNSRAAAR